MKIGIWHYLNLGDLIMSMTCARQIKARWPECHITWFTKGGFMGQAPGWGGESIYPRCILDANPYIDRVVGVTREERDFFWGGIVERQTKYSPALGIQFDEFYDLHYRGDWDAASDVRGHLIQCYLAYARCDPHDTEVQVYFTSQDLEKAREILTFYKRPIIAYSERMWCGNNTPRVFTQVAAERFRDKLMNRFGADHIILVGRWVRHNWHGQEVLLNVRESAALLSQCDILLTEHGGLSHLAAGVRTRCVEMFAASRWDWCGPGKYINKYYPGLITAFYVNGCAPGQPCDWAGERSPNARYCTETGKRCVNIFAEDEYANRVFDIVERKIRGEIFTEYVLQEISVDVQAL